ncbi:MAG: SulP family inorganic anion transporter [Candidatus Methylacidiphilales bacterium]|nr:SulP family inorganic anion transporter [Candidatus Methylacidiphilales bacterium]
MPAYSSMSKQNSPPVSLPPHSMPAGSESLARWFPVRPKIFSSLQGYTLSDFLRDLGAGVTVGIVALPLAMAFAIASGVPPQSGIYTAILAGFIISFFGGCSVQIGGPTAAFISVIALIVQKQGYEGLVICTILAGIILMIMGLAKMGSLIKFIPYPITSGFTSGIAVSIFLSQIKDFFGLQIGAVPAEFFDKVRTLGTALPLLNPTTTVMSVLALAFLWIWPRYVTRRVPASILLLAVATVVTIVFQLPVETIQTRFGGIPAGLPSFHWPQNVTFARIQELLPSAITIAILAGIESLLCAVVADGLTGSRHNSNTELFAQGLANLASPFMLGIPATGAIARTATNIENGARTPVAGIIHSLTLLIILLLGSQLAKHIPLSVLSAIVMLVAMNMGEWHELTRLRRMPGSDAIILLTTFLLTVIFDLTIAVMVGMVLAAFLFMKRISDTTQISLVTEENEQEGAHHSVIGKELPPGVLVYRIYGAFFFGAAEKMEEALENISSLPKVLILKMHTVPAMDATALNVLESVWEKMRRHDSHIVLSGPHTQPYFMMMQAGFVDKLGSENVCGNVDDALARAKEILGSSKS